jgi:transposase
LLITISGIGDRVSSTLLGEIPHIQEFRNGKALAVFVGLCPRERRSGTSISVSWLSKVGNTAVRAVLYMPAIAAMRRWNPILSKWETNLRARGKRPKQIIAAVMRRLLVLAYGVLKSGRAFDPSFALDGRHRI